MGGRESRERGRSKSRSRMRDGSSIGGSKWSLDRTSEGFSDWEVDKIKKIVMNKEREIRKNNIMIRGWKEGEKVNESKLEE